MVSPKNNRLRNMEVVRLQATKDLEMEKEEEEKKVWTTMDGWMDYQDKQPFHLSRECLVSMYT